jgi:hypothetical protein
MMDEIKIEDIRRLESEIERLKGELQLQTSWKDVAHAEIERLRGQHEEILLKHAKEQSIALSTVETALKEIERLKGQIDVRDTLVSKLSGTTKGDTMTFFKIEAGRYMFGQTYIVKHKPIPGRQQTTTWRDAVTGEWLGYTLAEAKEAVKRKAAE